MGRIFSTPGQEHTWGAKLFIACFFWLTFPFKEWQRETGFASWVWCMVFLTSVILTFLFFTGVLLLGSVEGGLGMVFEQIKYTIRRLEPILANWFALDVMDLRGSRDYRFAYFPFLYRLPIYGTFIHFFFKPPARFYSWK